MQPEHLQKIMGYYVEDAKDHLNTIEQHLLNLQTTIEDPDIINELLGAARCGIVGGANMLPISPIYINSIRETGFCLVDCFKVFQHKGSVKVDRELKDLLMQVFYILKELIESLREPSTLTDDKAAQVMSEIELIRKAFREHLNGLVQRSHSTKLLEVAIISDMPNDLSTLEDLESLIDNLSLDSSSCNDSLH
jgi:chemosensory pili system protein ChpA (sensor histidine kinase/response regulator)